MDEDRTETLHKRADELSAQLHNEIDRLLNCGAVDDSTGLNAILRVALENLAERYDRGTSCDYKNLKKF